MYADGVGGRRGEGEGEGQLTQGNLGEEETAIHKTHPGMLLEGEVAVTWKQEDEQEDEE